MRTTAMLLVTVTALTFAAAACGDDDSDVTTTGPQDRPEAEEPEDPREPEGEPLDFVYIGTLEGVGIDHFDQQAARTGSPQHSDLAGQVRQVVESTPDVETALTREPEAGHEGFLFLLTGCQEDTAELVVTASEIGATVVSDGAEMVSCYVPEYYLATFQVASAELPPDAELDR